MTETPVIDKRANLKKLADYLAALPTDYAAFEMEDFLQPVSRQIVDKMNDDFRKAEREYALNNGGVAQCGAVACAIGHGPTAGIHALPEHMKGSAIGGDIELRTINWFAYADTFFLEPRADNAFEWMFGGGWSNYDNTHQGAAKRIYYFLENGVPDDFEDAYADASDYFVALYQEY